MESTMNFVAIIIIVFGILQIILFFKLWGMTDDVRKIRSTVQANGYPENVSSAIIEFALENIEKAQGIAKREFVCEVFKLYIYVKIQLDSSRDQEYVKGYNEIERKYREMFDNASSFIEFGKFSTFENAKKVFH